MYVSIELLIDFQLQAGAIFFLMGTAKQDVFLRCHLLVRPSNWIPTSTTSTRNSRDLRTCVSSSDDGGNAFLLIFKQILER